MPAERVVDVAPALAGRIQRGSGHRQFAQLELADLGRGDEVQADDLDRRVEPVGVFALVDVVELLDQRRDASRR